MSKHEDFNEVINTLKALSPTITDAQRKGLLQQAVQELGLSYSDADEILKSSGLIVGDSVNYFQVLGLSLEELQDQSEDAITTRVDAAHQKYYSDSLRAGGLPRPDGRTQEQWRTVLNQARDTLKNPQKRTEHIASLQNEISEPIKPIQTEEIPASESDKLYKTEDTSLSHSITDDMVYIPAGEFQMGSKNDKSQTRKLSSLAVYVDAFYIDKYPVTNAQYKRFVDANTHWAKKPPKWWSRQNRIKKIMLSIIKKYHGVNYLKLWNGNEFPRAKSDHPVTHVSWYAAMAYSQWAGKRLPTEAEWEKAARGGKIGQKYPWGNQLNSDMAYCGTEIGETTSIGKYPPNSYGLYDMVGNVWEWCLDEYDPDVYSSTSAENSVSYEDTKEDLDLLLFRTHDITTDRVLRGGTQFTSSEPVQTVIRRGSSPILTAVYLTNVLPRHSTKFATNVGFRCAWDVQLKSKSL